MSFYMPTPYVVTNPITVTLGTADLTVGEIDPFDEIYGYDNQIGGTLTQGEPELISTNIGQTDYDYIFSYNSAASNYFNFVFSSNDEAQAVYDYLIDNSPSLYVSGTGVFISNYNLFNNRIEGSDSNFVKFTSLDIGNTYTMEWV